MSPKNNLDYPGGLKKYIVDRVELDPVTGCWIWQKSLDGAGFPKARVDRTYWGVNRLAYVLWIGDVPAMKAVRQECRNRACVNPKHLILANPGRVVGLDPTVSAERTECVNGHPWPEFLYTTTHSNGSTRRACRECNRISSRASQKRRRDRQNGRTTETKVSTP